jgi:hypothetical protein
MVPGVEMQTTVQSKSYQDPLEGSFEKRLPWTVIFSSTDDDAPVHIVANDFSGREFSLPVGAILEFAEALRLQQALTN